jgi:RNA polymerase sigma factor (sigma-70 family)
MSDDLALLAAWQEGDTTAGQALFSRHFREVHRFFENKVGAEADELSQRTFLACVGSRTRFRGQSSFRTFLFAIARHELYAHFRRNVAGGAFDAEVSSIAELVTSPSSRMARAEEHDRLRRALQELPAEQQLILELHYWHELDAEALGEVFAVPPGTIRVRLLRARRALRQRLGGAVPEAAATRAADPLLTALSQADDEDDARPAERA